MSLLSRATRPAARLAASSRRLISSVSTAASTAASTVAASSLRVGSSSNWLIGGAAVVGAAIAATANINTAAAAAAAASESPAVVSNPATPFVRVSDSIRVGLVQLAVGADKESNLKQAEKKIAEAAKQGAKLIVLPEMFNCPYSNASFNPYSEELPSVSTPAAGISSSNSPTAALMSRLARTHGVYLVAGSIPERASDAAMPKHQKSGLDHHLYNTCLVFSPTGDVVAKHRKVHLFDIDVPGKMTFKESDTLSPGSQPTWFDTPFARIGLGICYDIRFNEYATMLSERGATMLIYPGAFNTTTGPLHWELLQRARAVDNQLWVLTCSPARSADLKSYQAWGHSSAISPWGRVVATTEHEPAIVIADVDMKEVDDMRASIPVRTQKRKDLYHLMY